MDWKAVIWPVKEHATLLKLFYGSLTAGLLVTAEKTTLGIFFLMLRRCLARDWWSVFSWDACPGYTQLSPTLSYKDIVSTCGATQWWVLQKCCLICLCFEVSSSLFLERKATKIKTHFKLFLGDDFIYLYFFVCVFSVLIMKPCQIASYLTLYCFHYCLYASTHKQHDLVYHSRFTCFRHCWSFHWWLHTTVIHPQMGD